MIVIIGLRKDPVQTDERDVGNVSKRSLPQASALRRLRIVPGAGFRRWLASSCNRLIFPRLLGLGMLGYN